LTGVIVALPIIATAWAITTFIQFIDEKVWRFIPPSFNPKTYIGFDIWGLGLVLAVLGLIMLGTFASNFVGTSILSASERLLARVPVVRGVYSFVKQIVVIVAQQRDQAFKEVCLIEYPRKGLWAIGFVLFAKRKDIQILDMTPEEGAKMIISGGMVSSNEDAPANLKRSNIKVQKEPIPKM